MVFRFGGRKPKDKNRNWKMARWDKVDTKRTKWQNKDWKRPLRTSFQSSLEKLQKHSLVIQSNSISSNPCEKKRISLINTPEKIASKMKLYDSFAINNTAELVNLLQDILHSHISSFWKYCLNFYSLKNKLTEKIILPTFHIPTRQCGTQLLYSTGAVTQEASW